MSKIFIIGATGGVGSRLGPMLVRAGHTVTALHRNREQPVVDLSGPARLMAKVLLKPLRQLGQMQSHGFILFQRLWMHIATSPERKASSII